MQGHAVKAGMMIARGQNLLFMDADGATKVSDVEKLEKALNDSCHGEFLPDILAKGNLQLILM